MKTSTTQRTVQPTGENTPIKDRVFATLSEQSVTPRRAYWFWCEQWLVWMLWAVSIAVGALSFAVLLFASTYRYYDIYEATHDNLVTFLIDVIPYIWLIVFVCMWALAVWQLRYTSRGYRFSSLALGLSSAFLSIVLGSMFHLSGFGLSFDRWLGHVAPMYASQIEREQQLWQNPAAGRLLGQQVSVSSSTAVRFVDNQQRLWRLIVSDLTNADKAYLRAQARVRVLGVETVSGDEFHACGVFPWMLDGPAAMADMSDMRRQFVARLYDYHSSAGSRRALIQAAVENELSTLEPASPCHRLRPVVNM